jgi:lysophospholipase L1-like esterase
LKRLRLALIVLFATTIAFELGLRVYARLTHKERGLAYDSELGWRMIPGVEKVGRFWSGSRPARVNSHGWRDAETAFEDASGKRRMVVVGDSFTFGVGVDAEERYTDVLETLVPDLDVINLGMNAVGTDQELLVLEKEGLRYGPALVLCELFEGNDFADVGYLRSGYLPKPWFRLEAGVLEEVPPERTWDVTLRQCGYLGELAFRLVQKQTSYRVEAPEWLERDTTPLVEALLLRMSSSAAQAGARFLVLLVRVPGDGRTDALLPALAAAGIPVIDTGPRLEEPSQRSRLYLPDGHWSPAGHRVAAEMLAEALRTLGS